MEGGLGEKTHKDERAVASPCLSATEAGAVTPYGRGALRNTTHNLGSVNLLSHKTGARAGSKIKLTGNKPNQSRALTKGTRNISTVSHPTGWPRARNFHYNFSKRGKGEKIFYKTIIKAPTLDALLYNQNL